MRTQRLTINKSKEPELHHFLGFDLFGHAEVPRESDRGVNRDTLFTAHDFGDPQRRHSDRLA